MKVNEGESPTVVVIGATGGIGSELLKYLSNAGNYQLIGTYNKSSPQEIENVEWFKLDTTSSSEVELFFADIRIGHRITGIIDCTGAFYASSLGKTDLETISYVVKTNLISPLWIAKEALENMDLGGSLIYLSSIVTQTNPRGSSIYSISKAGVEQAVRSLSPEFVKVGKRINAIRLGYTNYGMTHRIKPKVLQDLLATIPSKQFGTINELGTTIEYLLADYNTHTSGAIINLAGGL